MIRYSYHMSPTRSEGEVPRRGQLHGEVARALREMILQLTLFNRHVAGNLDLKDVDHACLNLIERHGPLSPRDLTSRARATSRDRDGGCRPIGTGSMGRP